MNKKPEIGDIWTFSSTGGATFLLLEEEISDYYPDIEWKFNALMLETGQLEKLYFKKYARLYGGWRQLA